MHIFSLLTHQALWIKSKLLKKIYNIQNVNNGPNLYRFKKMSVIYYFLNHIL